MTTPSVDEAIRRQGTVLDEVVFTVNNLSQAVNNRFSGLETSLAQLSARVQCLEDRTYEQSRTMHEMSREHARVVHERHVTNQEDLMNIVGTRDTSNAGHLGDLVAAISGLEGRMSERFGSVEHNFAELSARVQCLEGGTYFATEPACRLAVPEPQGRAVPATVQPREPKGDIVKMSTVVHEDGREGYTVSSSGELGLPDVRWRVRDWTASREVRERGTEHWELTETFTLTQGSTGTQESWEKALNRREMLVLKVKCSAAYQKLYNSPVTRELRERGFPGSSTPRAGEECTRREFDQRLQLWQKFVFQPPVFQQQPDFRVWQHLPVYTYWRLGQVAHLPPGVRNAPLQIAGQSEWSAKFSDVVPGSDMLVRGRGGGAPDASAVNSGFAPLAEVARDLDSALAAAPVEAPPEAGAAPNTRQ